MEYSTPSMTMGVVKPTFWKSPPLSTYSTAGGELPMARMAMSRLSSQAPQSGAMSRMTQPRKARLRLSIHSESQGRRARQPSSRPGSGTRMAASKR